MRSYVPTVVLATFFLAAFCSAQISDRGLDFPGPQSPSPGTRNHSSPIGRMGSVAGIVLGSDDKPVSDVHVEIRNQDTGTTLASGYTNESGTFEFNNLPVTSCQLVVTRRLEQAQQQVEPGEAASSLKIRLNTGDAASARAGGSTTVSVAEYRVPEKARDAFHKAQAAMNKNKLDEAKKNLAKALEGYPDYAPALTLRGVLSLDEGNTESSIKDFDHAIHSDPGFALAYTAMAAALNQLRKFDDALRSADRAIALAPASWQCYFELAKSYLGKADYQHALEQLAKAQGFVQTDYAPLHLARAHAMIGLKDYDKAATELETFLKLAPHDPNSAAAQAALEKLKALTASATNNATPNAPK